MSVALPSSETSRKHIAKQLALCLLLIFTPALTTYAGERWSFTVIPPAPANCPQCQVTPITVGPYPCNTGAGCCLDWWGSAEYRYKQECGSPPLPKCVITGLRLPRNARDQRRRFLLLGVNQGFYPHSAVGFSVVSNSRQRKGCLHEGRLQHVREGPT